jgi:hypothetical protein
VERNGRAGRPSASCETSITGTGTPLRSITPATQAGAPGIDFGLLSASTSAICATPSA